MTIQKKECSPIPYSLKPGITYSNPPSDAITAAAITKGSPNKAGRKSHRSGTNSPNSPMPILGKKGKAGVKRERDDSDDGPQFHSPGKVNRQWTEEDGKLIKKLKEEDGLTWAQITSKFPGCTVGQVKGRYNIRLKSLCESFAEQELKKLKEVLEAKKKSFWNEVGVEMGKTGKACLKAAKEELKIDESIFKT